MEGLEVRAYQGTPDDTVGLFRRDVWVGEGVSSSWLGEQQVWLDSVDDKAFHWMILCDGEIVATARLSLHDSLEHYSALEHSAHDPVELEDPVAVLGRLVVKREFRGRGIASWLDAERVRRATQLGAKVAVAYAAPGNRIKALESLGFTFHKWIEIVAPSDESIKVTRGLMTLKI